MTKEEQEAAEIEYDKQQLAAAMGSGGSARIPPENEILELFRAEYRRMTEDECYDVPYAVCEIYGDLCLKIVDEICRKFADAGTDSGQLVSLRIRQRWLANSSYARGNESIYEVKI